MENRINPGITYRHCPNLDFCFPCYQPKEACKECEIRPYATTSIFPQAVHEEIARRRNGSSPPEKLHEER